MKQKNVVLLIIAAMVLLVAAVWSSLQHGSEKKLADGGPLLPGLSEQIDAVTDIRVVTRGTDDVVQIALQKKGDAWIVADRNYRADTKKLSTLITALVQAKRAEAKTAKAEHYVKLSVADPAQSASGAGKLVRLLKADGTPVAEVVLGGNASGRKGQYARVGKDAQVWLIDTAADVPATSTLWLDHTITDINAADVIAVDFGTVKLRRAGDDKPLELAAIPAGHELTYDGVTAAAASALSSLQLQDVVDAASITLPKPAATALFTTKANVTIAVAAYHEGSKNYLTLKAAALEKADDAARKQVDAWNAAWAPWAYDVDNFTYNKFVKSINDFTKEKPKQKAS